MLYCRGAAGGLQQLARTVASVRGLLIVLSSRRHVDQSAPVTATCTQQGTSSTLKQHCQQNCALQEA